MTMQNNDMPERIYLLHNEGYGGDHIWCDHVPDNEMTATKYVRADKAIPEGMALVPKRITSEDGYKHALIGEFYETVERIDGEGVSHFEKVPVSWTTIKDIHDAIVRLAAAPQPDPIFECDDNQAVS